jgi:peptidoglycan/LPS O-acetylase OafA/YrhL
VDPVSKTSIKSGGERFELLLPLRGLIALAVVLHHVASFDVGVRSARVVMFFVISGYCIFASAESASAGGKAAREWLGRRVLRLWPPYLLAVGYLFALLLAGVRVGHGMRLQQGPLEWTLNATLLSWVRLIGAPTHAAWQNPALAVPMHWTLGYEVQFYALVALILGMAWLGRSRLKWCAAALGVLGAIGCVMQDGAQRGVLTDYGACFVLGAMAFYRNSATTRRAKSVLDAGMILALTSTLIVIVRESSAISHLPRSAAVEIAVGSAFALGLVIIRPLDATVNAWAWIRPLKALGRMSYSLFLVHPFNLPIAAALAGRMLPENAPGWLDVALQLGWHVALAAPFWWLCERPFAQRRERVVRADPGLPAPATAPVSAMLSG